MGLFISGLITTSNMWLATETHRSILQAQHLPLETGTSSQLPQAIATAELIMPRSLDASGSPSTRNLALNLPINDNCL